MSTGMQSLQESCPPFLSADHMQQAREGGWLAFANVLTSREVDLARSALSRVARGMVSGSEYSPPKLNAKGNHSGASYKRPASRSFMQLEAGFDPAGRPMQDVEMNVRKYMWFVEEDPVFERMISRGSLLHGVVQSLIGANPILFQEMALVKPAHVGCEKPWHQDNAYFSVSPLDATLGVWIALDDATVDNGCMHVIPGGHREGGFRHHHGTDCEIDASLLAVDRVTPVPIPAGGAMFFHGMLPHQTPPNHSPERRRALQFHFRSAGSKIVEEQTYDEIFVTRNNEPASCRSASRLGF